MRFKKQKRHRKTVRFYTTCFGFRAPFKVLCDGTFVHHLLVNRITPADSALSNVLGATVKVFTTRCVLAELNSLGKSYSESLKAARNLITARCDHEKRKSAMACMMEVVGEKNPEHFFLATQDADLRKKFQEVPGVPLIYGLRNALLLETPSSIQRQFTKSTEEGRLHMSGREYEMLRMENTSAAEEAMEFSGVKGSEGDQNAGTHAMRKTNAGGMRIGVKDTVQFKRKKAKGPNPLSCKKKKNLGHATSVSKKEGNHSTEPVRSRSKKRRKRSRNGKKLVETNG